MKSYYNLKCVFETKRQMINCEKTICNMSIRKEDNLPRLEMSSYGVWKMVVE